GDPKKMRAEELQREAEARRFSDPVGASYSTDLYGRGLDYDMRGNMRPMVVNNTYNVQTWDATNLHEFVQNNATEFSGAVARAVNDGNGDDLVGTMKQSMAL
ncbi:MAG: hypothetical protein LLG20_26270, partial [Acidobacteriales bacterium]|nr:hypothetical protein [Terriglobales bacterium]